MEVTKAILKSPGDIHKPQACFLKLIIGETPLCGYKLCLAILWYQFGPSLRMPRHGGLPAAQEVEISSNIPKLLSKQPQFQVPCRFYFISPGGSVLEHKKYNLLSCRQGKDTTAVCVMEEAPVGSP